MSLMKSWLSAAGLAAGMLLSPSFNTAAQAQTTETTARLAWDAPVGVEVCAYVVYGKGTPGFIGEQGTITQIVPGNVTVTTVPRDTNAETTVYAVASVLPAAGQTCATTPSNQYTFSGLSNEAFVNNNFIWYMNQGGPNFDADSDGIPDLMETQFTQTNPNNPDSDGDGIKDGEEYALWEQWAYVGWWYDLNNNGTNGLNDPNSDYTPGQTCPIPADNEQNWPDGLELRPQYQRAPYLGCR